MLVRLRFGSWGKFLKVMGVEPIQFIPTKNGITRMVLDTDTEKENEYNFGIGINLLIGQF